MGRITRLTDYGSLDEIFGAAGESLCPREVDNTVRFVFPVFGPSAVMGRLSGVEPNSGLITPGVVFQTVAGAAGVATSDFAAPVAGEIHQYFVIACEHDDPAARVLMISLRDAAGQEIELGRSSAAVAAGTDFQIIFPYRMLVAGGLGIFVRCQAIGLAAGQVCTRKRYMLDFKPGTEPI